MVGFFLPGDSLLVTAGLFAARGDLDIRWLIPSLILAAISGNATGYYIGRRAGKALYSRPNSFFFRREHLIRTHAFYERHGGKTIILAQLMPIVRTFAPGRRRRRRDDLPAVRDLQRGRARSSGSRA